MKLLSSYSKKIKRYLLFSIKLEWEGSNLRITESKSIALPLGYIPVL